MKSFIAIVTAVAAQAAPPDAFSVCRGCHVATKETPSTIGPNLFGVTQRKSGTLPGFSYSPAMTSAGLPWNAANLKAFVMRPQKTVPGTRMPYGGQMDAAKAQAIVSYLESLK